MITKDQLEQLRQAPEPENTREYTIGGSVENSVHSTQEQDRQRQLREGQHTLNHAVASFRENMAFKSREGMARGPFLHSSAMPDADKTLAEQTWQDNHRVVHEEKLDHASRDFRRDLTQATQYPLPLVDTDMGYGKGRNASTLNHYVSNTNIHRQQFENEQVSTFFKTLSQSDDRHQDIER